jgi:hypothetical protein
MYLHYCKLRKQELINSDHIVFLLLETIFFPSLSYKTSINQKNLYTVLRTQVTNLHWERRCFLYYDFNFLV